VKHDYWHQSEFPCLVRDVWGPAVWAFVGCVWFCSALVCILVCPRWRDGMLFTCAVLIIPSSTVSVRCHQPAPLAVSVRCHHVAIVIRLPDLGVELTVSQRLSSCTAPCAHSSPVRARAPQKLSLLRCLFFLFRHLLVVVVAPLLPLVSR